MRKDEHTSKKIASLASNVLLGKIQPTRKQILSIAGAALTNAANKPKKRK